MNVRDFLEFPALSISITNCIHGGRYAANSDLSKQFSMGSIEKKGGISACRNLSFDIKLLFSSRFNFGRQSSLDPHRRSNCFLDELAVLENLDCMMRLLFLACHGDVHGVEELLQEGDDVNSIDLDGRTVLHIAACKEHLEVVSLLIRWRANIDARYRWGSMEHAIDNPPALSNHFFSPLAKVKDETPNGSLEMESQNIRSKESSFINIAAGATEEASHRIGPDERQPLLPT